MKAAGAVCEAIDGTITVSFVVIEGWGEKQAGAEMGKLGTWRLEGEYISSFLYKEWAVS